MNSPRKVALITGSGSGIGRATALFFAQHDVNLILFSKTQKKIDETAQKVKEMGCTVFHKACDITNTEAMQAAIDVALTTMGRIDYVINCAGVFKKKNIEDMSLSEWQRIIDINLTGTFIVCKTVLPYMKKAQSGSIINFSSIGGKRGLPEAGAYCASKYGVVGFSKALSKEIKAWGIKVHIVYPYLVDSSHDIAWDKKTAESELSILHPDDVASHVYYLTTLPKRFLIEDSELMPFLY